MEKLTRETLTEAALAAVLPTIEGYDRGGCNVRGQCVAYIGKFAIVDTRLDEEDPRRPGHTLPDAARRSQP